ncbi:MAG TPA: ABC transporter permease [Gemmatimonadaceae bacterium]|nr:ABC transporter permease [Gemmatimonadaceae bacterium]
MDTMKQDVHFALRQVRRTPMVSLFIVATLAVGIGATAAIFSAVDTLLLRPIYADEHQLVKLNGAYKNRGDEWSVSLPNAGDWASRNRSFSSVAWYQRVSMTLNDAGSPDRIQVVTSTPTLFRVLDVTPLIGRLIADENARPDGERVVVLSHGLWQTRFGGDKAVIGKIIDMNGRPATVIGVMRPGFAFPSSNVAAYMALRATASTWPRSNGGLSVLARMRPGVDIVAAQRDLDDLSRRLESEYPAENKEFSAKVRTFRNALVGPDLTKALYFLSGAVVLVLLIACVNVANLLLSRATEREREIAVRAALGAGRARVVRQLLTEGLVLALLGGALGIVVAALAVRAFPALIPAEAELPRGFSLDWRVLVVGLVVTMVTGVAFSVLPALKATATDLTSLMGVRASRGSRRQRDRRGALVILEVALAVILLASTGLAIKGLDRLLQMNPGFRPERLLTARIPLDGVYRDTTQARLFQERLLAEIRSTPGVERASVVDFAPLSGTNNFNDITIEGGDPTKPANVGTIMMGPDYLEAMGIPLLSGRGVRREDVRSAPQVVAVNRTLADKLFPGQNPIGKRVLFSWEGGANPNWRTIVGLYGDVRHGGLDTDKSPQRMEIAVPIAQLPFAMNELGLVVRSRTDPQTLVPALRRVVNTIAPAVPLFEVHTMTSLIDRTSDVLLGRILASVLAVFGVIAMLLAALGLYGVISYSVTTRTFEIGVRSALGADRGAVVRMIMGQGGRLVVMGLVSGLVGAVLAARVMRSLLHGVSPADPFALGGTVAVLLVIGALGSLLPALRASRIEPTEALRSQ